MRKPQGYGVIEDPELGRFEQDTFTCKHCQRIVVVPAKASPSEVGGWCYRCDAMVCPICQDSGECVPFERAMEIMEDRDRFRRNLGI